MSSKITVYTKHLHIDGENKDRTDIDLVGDFSVILDDVDAGDFVGEFSTNEILGKMEFSDIEKWYITNKVQDDEDFSGAE